MAERGGFDEAAKPTKSRSAKREGNPLKNQPLCASKSGLK